MTKIQIGITMHKYKPGDKVFCYQDKWPSNTKRTKVVLGKVFTIKREYSAHDAKISYEMEDCPRQYFDESELSLELANSPLIKALS